MTTPSSPKKSTWNIGLAAGLLGIIGHFTKVKILTDNNYELQLRIIAVGFISLAAGTTFRELQPTRLPVMYVTE